MLQDLRYALRILWKSPAFTAVAMLTLAVGIGANTAIFSVINAVLLRPLPFRNPQQLVSIGAYDNRSGSNVPKGSMSYPDFRDIGARNHSFSAVAAYSDNDFTVTGVGQPIHAQTETSSTNLFSLLGTQPSLGRAFADGEDSPGHHVAILSDIFWRRQFNADRGVIGRTLNLNGRPYTVIGVMPAGFQFPVEAEPRDLWITYAREAEVDDPKDQPQTEQRGNHHLNVIARMKSGVPLQAANADVFAIARAISSEYSKSNAHVGMGIRSELDSLVGDTRTPLLVLFGAVGLVLLIACANVANLLLTRAAGRSREIAIRAALGATRLRVIRQLIAESLALSVAGALLGVGIAEWALVGILKLYPSNLPRAADISLDYRVLLFTAGLAVCTGIIFGLVPALQVSKPNLSEAMREGGRTSTAGAGHHRLRAALVVAETALGMMLLIGAGLLIRSFDRLSRVDLGLNPDHVLTASFDLSETRYNPDQQDRFVQELLARIKALPAVSSVAGAIPLPLSDNNYSVSFNLLDHPLPEANHQSAGFYVVTPGFFETLQIPLVRGRAFDSRDQRNSPPVMIINQEFARKYFPNEDPIGHRIEIGAGEGPSRASYKTREVVGIVGNLRRDDLARSPQAAYFVPLPQLMWGPPTLAIRAAGDPIAITAAVRKVLAGMDPEAPLYEVRTLADYLALDLGRARFQTTLLALFAGIALALTAVGLYGVMSYTVIQRTQEIGIRVALGATRKDVMQMILHKSFSMTGIGLLLGIAGATALTRVLSALLYETNAFDPFTFIVVSLTLVFVSLLASYLPALRAANLDPMNALRQE